MYYNARDKGKETDASGWIWIWIVQLGRPLCTSVPYSSTPYFRCVLGPVWPKKLPQSGTVPCYWDGLEAKCGIFRGMGWIKTRKGGQAAAHHMASAWQPS
jgi:hypothetical protein